MPPDDFTDCAIAVEKKTKSARNGFIADALSGIDSQAIKSAAHIDRRGANIDSDRRIQAQDSDAQRVF